MEQENTPSVNQTHQSTRSFSGSNNNRVSQYIQTPDPETIRIIKDSFGDYWNKDLDYYANYLRIRWGLQIVITFDNDSHAWRWLLFLITGRLGEQQSTLVSECTKFFDTYKQALESAICQACYYYKDNGLSSERRSNG